MKTEFRFNGCARVVLTPDSDIERQLIKMVRSHGRLVTLDASADASSITFSVTSDPKEGEETKHE